MQNNFLVKQADYSAAFLRAKIPENGPQTYLKPLHGMEMEPEMDCVRLLRGVYGLHSASSLWAEKLGSDLEELGFVKSKVDPALFVRRGKPLDGEERGQIECIISTYVDDCLVCVRDEATWEKLIEDMKNQYKDSKVKTFSSDPGPLTHTLGMHVIRGDGWIELSHEDAINNLIDEYGVRKMPGKFTPLASTKTPLSKADCPTPYSNEERIMKNKPYRRLIGQLLHISGYTRWDIRYSVCFLARFANNPGKKHWKAAIHILQYLKQTIHLHLRFGKPKNKGYLPLVKVKGADWNHSNPAGPYLGGELAVEKSKCQIFSDTSFADCKDTARSTGGYCVYVEGCPISMESKRQGTVSRSTAIAELYGLDKATREAKYMSALLKEFDYDVKFVDVIGDNSTAIGLATSAKHSQATKHVRVAERATHEAIQEGCIRLYWCPSAFNVADIFTKNLPRETHTRLTRVLLGLGGEEEQRREEEE